MSFCKHKELENYHCSWWLCYNCHSKTCKCEQAFNGRIVIFCINCYEEWLKGSSWEYFLKQVLPNLVFISKDFVVLIKKELECEKI